MDHRADPRRIHQPSFRDGAGRDRAPAVTVVIAIGAGIALDRHWQPAWSFWILAAVVSLAAALLCCRREYGRLGTWGVVLLWACLGGARHHATWSLRERTDISQYAGAEPHPVALVGCIHTPVETVAADQDAFTPAWMRLDRSVCQVRCETLLSGTEELPVSGTVRLDVSGHLLQADVGDRVRILGALARPRPPQNPGAFDFQTWLRDRGIDCLVRTDHPDAVQRLETGRGVWRHVARWRHELRQECRRVLVEHLQPRCVPVAASLLLGDRTGMPDEIDTAFIESGTMHLLAISGLHVSLLAGMLYLGCRLLNVSPVTTAVILLVGIGGYAFITDHRAPVIRAAVLAAVVVSALPSAQRVSGMNTLAVSALVVLLWRPTDLFDIGAQLSFLAVVGILCSVRWMAQWRRTATVRDTALTPEPGPLGRWLGAPLAWLGQCQLMTAAIWLFTLPLTMSRFHLASPIGFLLNVVLVPFSAVILAAGFGLLLCGLLLPWLAPVAGWIFDVTIVLLIDVVAWSAATPLGHLYLPGPSDGWLVGWYSLLAVGSGLIRLPIPRRWVWRSLALWTVCGLAWGLRSTDREDLKCTFLSVGHGCAVLLELPDGKTLLYDAGTLGSGQRAQRAVQEALWSAGRSRLDAVIISHADVDHFSGVAGLLATVPTGEVLFAPSFLDFEQSSVRSLCDAAASAGVPLRLLWRSDRLRVDPDVSIDVLHPPCGPGDALDNANSIVLRLRYAGRTILLTGDLEDSGLQALFSLPAEPVDVMLSPHHGSKRANPPELAAWARPKYVVASAGAAGAVKALEPIYRASGVVLSTAESGAVMVVVRSSGEMSVSEFARPMSNKGTGVTAAQARR
jgi:competence protein ComEC